MDVSLKAKKVELIQWVSTLEDQGLIDTLLDLRNQDQRDWWAHLSEEQKKSIEKGIEDAEAGKLESHTSVKEMYEKWL